MGRAPKKSAPPPMAEQNTPAVECWGLSPGSYFAAGPLSHPRRQIFARSQKKRQTHLRDSNPARHNEANSSRVRRPDSCVRRQSRKSPHAAGSMPRVPSPPIASFEAIVNLAIQDLRCCAHVASGVPNARFDFNQRKMISPPRHEGTKEGKGHLTGVNRGNGEGTNAKRPCHARIFSVPSVSSC